VAAARLPALEESVVDRGRHLICIGRPCAVVEGCGAGQGKAESPLAGSPPARRNPGGQAVSYLWGEESRRTSCICLISQR
jgi:hypothetical protein